MIFNQPAKFANFVTRRVKAVSLVLLLCSLNTVFADTMLFRYSSLDGANVPALITTPNGDRVDIIALRTRLYSLPFHLGDTISLDLDTNTAILHPDQTPYQVLTQNYQFERINLTTNIAAILPDNYWFTIGTSIQQMDEIGTALFVGNFNYFALRSSDNNIAELFDLDGDKINTGIDNCPNHANRLQADYDNDGIGDACDEDTLANSQVPIIYEDIPLAPVAIDASQSLGSCGVGPGTTAFSPIIQEVTVTDNYIIDSMLFGFTAAHTYRGDLRVTLESPLGTRIQVMNGDTTDNDNDYDLYLDDSSSAVIDNDLDDNVTAPFYERDASPDNPLSGFNGQSAKGVWKIEICDIYDTADNGEYIGSSLIFRAGNNTDSDPAANANDCAKLDPSRWQIVPLYLDTDGDGYGTGNSSVMCVGSETSGYAFVGGDNCPAISNPNQLNFDSDAMGDVCDPDDDNDGMSDVDELDAGRDPFDSSDASSLFLIPIPNGKAAIFDL